MNENNNDVGFITGICFGLLSFFKLNSWILEKGRSNVI